MRKEKKNKKNNKNDGSDSLFQYHDVVISFYCKYLSDDFTKFSWALKIDYLEYVCHTLMKSLKWS